MQASEKPAQLRTHAAQQISVRGLLGYVAPSLAGPPRSAQGNRMPDPRFPRRTDHPDYRRLAEALCRLDDKTKLGGRWTPKLGVRLGPPDCTYGSLDQRPTDHRRINFRSIPFSHWTHSLGGMGRQDTIQFPDASRVHLFATPSRVIVAPAL
jgi:hypothetical protein